MKSNQSLEVAREESFEIERPEVSVICVSSQVNVVESQDGKCHVRILAASKKALKLAELVEIVQVDQKLTVRTLKKTWSINTSRRSDQGLSVEIALPESAHIKIMTVSGNLEVHQLMSEIEIGSVSGDVTINQNPSGDCKIKTVSGDIATNTYSACNYILKSVSGDIKVYVAPDLNVEVDGNSVSGYLNSEIPLDGAEEASGNSDKVVKVRTSTVSGDFNLVRV